MTEQEKTEETPEETATKGGDAATVASEGATTEQPAATAAKPAAAAKPAKKEKEPAKPGGPSTAVVQRKMVPGTPIVSRRRVLQLGFWSGLGAMLAATRPRQAWAERQDRRGRMRLRLDVEERGTVALRLGLIDESEQYFRDSLERSQREEWHSESGISLLGLADIAASRGTPTRR